MGQKLAKDCQEQGFWCCAPGSNDAATELSGTGLYASAPATARGGQTRAAPQPASAPNHAARPAATESGLGAHVFDLLVSDIDGAEQVSYGEVFATLDENGSGILAWDSAPLRSFVVANSAIEEGNLDEELLRVSSMEDGGLSQSNFLRLLREHAVSDATALEEFLGMAQDSDVVPAQDCRDRLLLVAQRHLNANMFTEDQWDRIFNTVMLDADVVVPMERWIGYCKHVARICRVAHVTK